MNMKSPTQQAIIFLLEEYLKPFTLNTWVKGSEGVWESTPEELKVRALLEAIKGGE